MQGVRRWLAVLVPWCLRRILRRRYAVELRGFDALPLAHGMLVLANHPAEIDPLVLTTATWSQLHLRALVLQEFYDIRIARGVLWVGNALPIPDLEVTRTAESVCRLKQRLGEAVAGLHAGDNILLYPSGRLYRKPHETVGNASGTQLILKRYPEVPVLLVRIRGFWGSSFSCAAGSKPKLVKTLLAGAWALLRNGIFWCPRRTITITCEVAPADFPRRASRQELNHWLEQWFNQPGDEPLTRVPTTRARPRTVAGEQATT
jgi:long-chain-fatty-acid--[acyl-carrier-protein] ligase